LRACYTDLLQAFNQAFSRAYNTDELLVDPTDTEPGWYPSQTSMFWSHQQRQAGTQQQKQKQPNRDRAEYQHNGQHEHREGSAGYFNAGSRDFGVAEDCTTEHADVFGDATGRSQVHDFPYRRDFQRSGERKPQQQKQQEFKQFQQQQQQHWCPPSESAQARDPHGAASEVNTEPLSDTWHYVFSKPPPGDHSTLQRTDPATPSNVKLDDEVWYINGVPHQHAKTLHNPQYRAQSNVLYPPPLNQPPPPAQITPNPYQQPYPWTDADGGSGYAYIPTQPPPTHHPETASQIPVVFDPVRGYHVYHKGYASNANNQGKRTSQTHKTGYHLGAPYSGPRNQNNNSFLVDVELVGPKSDPSPESLCLSESPLGTNVSEETETASTPDVFLSLESESSCGSFEDAVQESWASAREEGTTSPVLSLSGVLSAGYNHETVDPSTGIEDRRVVNVLKADDSSRGKKIKIIRKSSQAREQAMAAANKKKPTRTARSGLISII